MTRSLRWLEIAADYHCNNRCIGCPSVRAEGPSMTSREIAESLSSARARGADSLWLGGGEPTLRKDLFAIVKRARALGYRRIRLQTNGMLLAYPEFADRCADAGITEVSFSIKGACAETHDAITETPGCHALLLRGIDEVGRRGLAMQGDILVYRQNLDELAEMVDVFHARGLRRFDVWSFWAPANDAKLAALVPRLTDVARRIVEILDAHPDAASDFLTSLHTPPCVLPETHHRALFFAPDLDLWVQNPDDRGFFLETSPIEGGSYLPGCAACRFRPRCSGFRHDYLELYGSDEVVPR